MSPPLPGNLPDILPTVSYSIATFRVFLAEVEKCLERINIYWMIEFHSNLSRSLSIHLLSRQPIES